MTKEDIDKYAHTEYQIITRAYDVAKMLYNEYDLKDPGLYQFYSDFDFDEAFVRVHNDGSIDVWSDETMNMYVAFEPNWKKNIFAWEFPYEALWDDSVLKEFAEILNDEDKTEKETLEKLEYEEYLRLKKKFEGNKK